MQKIIAVVTESLPRSLARRFAVAFLVAAVVAGALSSCRDTSPTVTAPALARPLLSKSGKVTLCHAGSGSNPKFTEITISENALGAHLGHENDYFVTNRTPCPPPATPGVLMVCKVGAAGIPAGTPFSFLIAGEVVSTPSGQCVSRSFRVGTTVAVKETVPANMLLSGLTLTPLEAGSTDQSTASASVIVGTDVATLTYTNQIKTLLVICKVAGTGVTVGTEASFSVTGVATPITIAAGAAPAGTCSDPISVQPGPLSVTETFAPGTAVYPTPAIDPTAALQTTTSSPDFYTVGLVIEAARTTRVTFTNVASYLEICKVAGSGVTVGTEASFSVTGIAAPITIAAGAGPTGTCSAPILAPPGLVYVTETFAPGTYVYPTPAIDPTTAIQTTTSGTDFYKVGLAIDPNRVTRITFTNVASYVVICKIAGNGVAVGTEATFSVAGVATPITLAAGAGPTGNCATPIAVPPGIAEVTETYAPGTHAGTPITNPTNALQGTLSNASFMTARVRILSAEVTTVTFTNVSNPP